MINKIPKTIGKAEKSRYLILTSWFTMRENGKADAIRLMPFSIVKGTDDLKDQRDYVEENAVFFSLKRPFEVVRIK